jgi:hypothetical protein
MQIFFRRAQHSRARVSGAHRMSLLELPSTAQKHRASDFCLRSVSGNQNVRGRSRQYTRTPRRFVDSESEGARETKSRKKIKNSQRKNYEQMRYTSLEGSEPQNEPAFIKWSFARSSPQHASIRLARRSLGSKVALCLSSPLPGKPDKLKRRR